METFENPSEWFPSNNPIDLSGLAYASLTALSLLIHKDFLQDGSNLIKSTSKISKNNIILEETIKLNEKHLEKLKIENKEKDEQNKIVQIQEQKCLDNCINEGTLNDLQQNIQQLNKKNQESQARINYENNEKEYIRRTSENRISNLEKQHEDQLQNMQEQFLQQMNQKDKILSNKDQEIQILKQAEHRITKLENKILSLRNQNDKLNTQNGEIQAKYFVINDKMMDLKDQLMSESKKFLMEKQNYQICQFKLDEIGNQTLTKAPPNSAQDEIQSMFIFSICFCASVFIVVILRDYFVKRFPQYFKKKIKKKGKNSCQK